MAPDDPLDPAALQRRLTPPSGAWRRVEVVATTGSTNADVAGLARAGEPAGAVLVAGHQSAGRGRRGRVWIAPPGTSVAISALVQPHVPARRWTWLPLLAGLAVVEGLGACAGVAGRLKWPNDVMVAGRKVCGILAERVETPTGSMCVLGMGINVHLTEADLPVPSATSLALLGLPVTPPRTEVAAAVLSSLARVLGDWTHDPEPVAAAYQAVSDTVGREVRVILAQDHTVAGRALGVDADGRLQLQTAAGLLVVGAGDVVHLR